MDTPRFEEAWAYALHRLENGLSPKLLYHSVSHTRDDVVPGVSRLAAMEGIEGIELSLLITAAWFHDLGFVKQPQYHELISVRIATEVLPDYGFAYDQVETVKWAILATALPQKPQNLLEAILTDADLDVLGREDYRAGNSTGRATATCEENSLCTARNIPTRNGTAVNWLFSNRILTSPPRRAC
ncbi:MAG: HD domain-containing protein [Chloroflexi bacterium CFX2]|nr:HD domain-containing protein [Chloroflexi bacterium CFX2]